MKIEEQVTGDIAMVIKIVLFIVVGLVVAGVLS